MKTLYMAIILTLVLSSIACAFLSGATSAPATATSTQLSLPSLTPGLAATSTPAVTLPPTLASSSPTPAVPAETSTLPGTAAPTALPDPRGEEAILILEPGPGSRLTSPAHIAGVANPTFEQGLAVRIILDDGTVLNTVPTIIQADIGQRGSFAVDIPFEIGEERQAFIQVIDTSARDGGTLHLASVGVILSPSGPADILVLEPQPERIAILQPTQGATLSGGVAHVEGFALASFEQTLLVEILDAEGNVVGQAPVIVNAPDLGRPGPFSIDVAYTAAAAGPGRVVVRDVSPAFGGDTHVSSVEVNLQP